MVVTSSQVFMNFAGKDFRIVATTGSGYPRNAGADLGSNYNRDMLEVVRGLDGTWDIGAYEYSSGTSSAVEPHTNLEVIIK